VAASILPELRDVETSSDSPCPANLAEMYFHIELRSSRGHVARMQLDGSSIANIAVGRRDDFRWVLGCSGALPSYQ
jgi:hypothetical protein